MSDVNYDIAAMRLAITACDKNIEVIEQAIAKEQTTKMQYKHIIRTLEEAINNPPTVSVEVVREN